MQQKFKEDWDANDWDATIGIRLSSKRLPLASPIGGRCHELNCVATAFFVPHAGGNGDVLTEGRGEKYPSSAREAKQSELDCYRKFAVVCEVP